MLSFADDEDFDARILRRLLRRRPTLDVARVATAGLSGAADPEVLAWAAREGRVLLTHDTATMTAHAYARVGEGQAMPGVVAVPQIGAPPHSLSIGEAIENILIVAELGEPSDIEGQVIYVPF